MSVKQQCMDFNNNTYSLPLVSSPDWGVHGFRHGTESCCIVSLRERYLLHAKPTIIGSELYEAEWWILLNNGKWSIKVKGILIHDLYWKCMSKFIYKYCPENTHTQTHLCEHKYKTIYILRALYRMCYGNHELSLVTSTLIIIRVFYDNKEYKSWE